MGNDGVDRSNHLHLPLTGIPMGSLALGGLGTHGARPGLMVEAQEDQGDVEVAKGMENRPVATPPRPPWDYAGELELTSHGRGC